MEIECEAGEEINLVRANYGRFSISICNKEGNTAWSVNCMEPRTLRVINKQCRQQSRCTVAVSSALFGDPCPGTNLFAPFLTFEFRSSDSLYLFHSAHSRHVEVCGSALHLHPRPDPNSSNHSQASSSLAVGSLGNTVAILDPKNHVNNNNNRTNNNNNDYTSNYRDNNNHHHCSTHHQKDEEAWYFCIYIFCHRGSQLD